MSHDSAISKSLAVGLLLFMFVQIILYGLLTQYAPPQNQLQDYIFFPDIHVMIFVGFGFLMSFLHKAGFTATSHAFFVAAYTVLWAILNRAFWKRAVLSSQQWSVQVDIGVTDLTNADFVAGAVLISFGALLGRVSIGQLTIMAIIEVVFYAMNEASIVYGLQISDAGGTYYIHMFGAYFGLVTSFVLHRMNKDLPPPKTEAEGSTRLTDTLAMVGTLFLYIYWPSFNAAGFANTNSHSRAIVNTFLSITMSTVTSFLVSVIVDKNGKINMVEVQNSTLAGGVAMGAAAGLVINPVGALITGFFAGTISVLGFRFITPALNSVVPDTCGVHNLHGMPSLLGAIVSAIAVGAARRGSYQGTYHDAVVDTNRAYDRNAGYQIVAIFVTLGFALFGGIIAGIVLSLSNTLPTFFDDKHEYNLPGEAHHVADEEMKEVVAQAEPFEGKPKELSS